MRRTLQRIGRLGALAGAMAARSVRFGPGRQEREERLVDRLGATHGLPQKVGQILGLTRNAAASRSLMRLMENRPSLSGNEALLEIERQLGRPWRECFRAFEPEGVSASIAQVHRANLHDGTEVAVKVQIPGLREQIGVDLRLLGWLAAPLGNLRRDFDLNAYRREIGSMLESELDFRREADALRTFGARAASWPDLLIPAVFDEFSGPSVLTMGWVPGAPLGDSDSWNLQVRRSFSATLIRLFLASCLAWRRLHADPHPGNYRFILGQGWPMVGLLDFGCVKDLTPDFVGGLRSLIADAQAESFSPERTMGHLTQMGFSERLLAPMRDRLPRLHRVLCEPFCTHRPFPVHEWRISERIGEILGEHRMAFRAAGAPESIYFLRGFHGWVKMLAALAAPVPWSRLLDGVLAEAPVSSAALKSDRPPEPIAAVQAPQSGNLCIRVTEGAISRVSLELPSVAAANLANLVPDDVARRLSERGVDLEAISQQARVANYAPGELFNLAETGRSVRVWLQ